ncbi:hypothetical protein GUJ93_ZPchr0011g27340 [Zizania palustris]|uniref:Glycine-rich protein n=1 Tax=Zizania palustris TaxID=103762 RepID=A0A8J5WJZ4_ZIZPA|nr:hypothetical protein GUJ93_ZPchr0011g27340 [Zizania palustris]
MKAAGLLLPPAAAAALLLALLLIMEVGCDDPDGGELSRRGNPYNGWRGPGYGRGGGGGSGQGRSGYGAAGNVGYGHELVKEPGSPYHRPLPYCHCPPCRS